MTVMVTSKNSGTLLPLHTFPPVGLSHLGRSQSPRQLHTYRNSRHAELLSGEGFLCDKTISVPKRNFHKRLEGKLRVFFLDVNPLCYRGAQPSLPSFANWLSLFFSEVSIRNPVIAVIKVNCFEADDVIASLTDQVLQRGHRVVIGSPDKDFKQLISEKVQMVMPMPELGRWSFYTLRHYIEQYNCDPNSDLSLRKNAEVHLKDEWLLERDSCNDSTVLSSFMKCFI
ncbi:hypothetical protein KFK09_011523 [Dendrobium nobile]|uniref:5'-3' exonuclease alpha-helical arch N-terminal domain-containing protein n=1 Tax=Dendrobium nobile TaxID=94219 RepID=A0A8T3BCX1_DENNO|nr:hypothetical protein KFK09_011523 [Dendrobium nobile]